MRPAVEHSTVSELFASWLAELCVTEVPAGVTEVAIRDLTDAAGLCIAARGETYVGQLLEASEDGRCTALGHRRALDMASAALVNGIAIHGEDFDDTLEGAPIRVGAAAIPAVLAVGERFGLSGERTLSGIIAGLESVCRLNHVAAGHMHRAGFHPVSVIGTLGAAAGAGVALGLDRDRLAAAFGIAASMSSGIIEYLTDGAWTKRLHPGWAAQAGAKAALIARTGFFAPRTVFEGGHNFFSAFAPTAEPDYSHLTETLGDDWYMSRIVFKRYACGTMIHPYIDCARQLRRDGIAAEAIDSIVCETGEGLVHRLWEPLAAKQRPPSGYAAKFSMPFCMALGFHEDDAGLAQFSEDRVAAPHLLEFASKVAYRIDPQNDYPRNYSGHMAVRLTSGEMREYRQPHMRGGRHEPLGDDAIVAKFHGNAVHGGWSRDAADELLGFCRSIGTAPDLSGLAAFRK